MQRLKLWYDSVVSVSKIGLVHHLAPAIAKSLATIYNESLENGVVPGEWKAANVSPIFNSGDKISVNNYRPISILPVVAKAFEKLVHQHIYLYLQKHKSLHQAQSGFRQGHTIQDVIVASVDDWRRGLDNNHLMGVVLVDLSKAFDSVHHDLLLCKTLTEQQIMMDQYGI